MVTLKGCGTRSLPRRDAGVDPAEDPLEAHPHLDPLLLVASQLLEGLLVGAERVAQALGQRLPALSSQHRKRCGRTLVAPSSCCQEIARGTARTRRLLIEQRLHELGGI